MPPAIMPLLALALGIIIALVLVGIMAALLLGIIPLVTFITAPVLFIIMPVADSIAAGDIMPLAMS